MQGHMSITSLQQERRGHLLCPPGEELGLHFPEIHAGLQPISSADIQTIADNCFKNCTPEVKKN